MNTAIYLRKSRADSETETVEETLKRHKEILLDFAKKNPNIKIVKIYEEVVSGDTLYARPEMLKLLEDSEKQIFDSVLCVEIDRLGRGNMSDQGIILNTFKYNNIKIITPREIYDMNNERDEDSLELETLKARWEYKSIKRRLHNGTIKSVNDGCYLWNAPYGYKNCKNSEKKSTLAIIENEANFVKIIFDMYANSDVGTQTIAMTINSMGAHPHRSDKFNRTSIVSILKNQVYIGKVVFNKKSTIKKGANGNQKAITTYHNQKDWIIVDGIHERIIDDDTFFRAQMKLKSKYHKPFFDGEIVNPLAGILKCKKCGHMMERRPFNNKKNKTVHLICQTKNCCKSSRLDYVENAVIENIKEKLKEIKITKIFNKKTIDYTETINAIYKELKSLITQKNNLYDLLEKGVYDIETFKNRSYIISNRLEILNQKLMEFKEKQEKSKNNDTDIIINKFENVLNLYYKASNSEKNKLLKKIIKSGTYYKEKSWKPNQFVITLEFFDL